MELQTPIQLPIGELEIKHTDGVMLFGSCFSQNMGTKLADAGFDVMSNPFGVLYNPRSIESVLRAVFLDSEEWRSMFHYDERQGLWMNWLTDTSFARESREECEIFITQRMEEARRAAKRTKVLILTLGTNRIYEFEGRCVTNCQKQPQNLFTERSLSLKECVEGLFSVLEGLKTKMEGLKVILTVSPVRYRKYGMHGSQLSKATLLLATEELRRQMTDVFYFPAYEIVVDELRDYRFYADDMVHPSSKAVEHIWDCFARSYFSQATMEAVKECEQFSRLLRHRPMTTSERQLKQFEQQIMLKKEQLKEKYPYFAFLCDK